MADELTWAHVMRPRIPLVYLDLNHVIALARVLTGHRAARPEYARLLEACQRAASEQRAMFPIGPAHVWEVSKIQDPRQRRHLADVLETLTHYHYLLGRVTIAHLELDAGFAKITKDAVHGLDLPLLRQTIGHAFGLKGGPRIVNQRGEDVTDDARAAMGPRAFDDQLAELNLQFERAALRGPDDDEATALRRDPNYRPELALQDHDSRVDFEWETGRILDAHPEWRRGRLRDLVSVREFTHEWLDLLNSYMADRAQAGRSSVDPTTEQMQGLLAGMPHVQVAISMKTSMHRNPSHQWTANDITDIDALSVAYAYCEAILTDRAARHTIHAAPELRSLRTFVPGRPDELTEWLDGQPSVTVPDLLVPHPLK